MVNDRSMGVLLTVLIAMILLFSPCQSANAALTLHLGPASVGGGGPNPVSIPPVSIVDYELVWVSNSQKEFSLSLFPGILYGYRATMKNGGYISIGGGLVLSVHGFGPGVYTAFGYDACSFTCFNFEYKQALGVLPGMLISPYALRVGITLRSF